MNTQVVELNNTNFEDHVNEGITLVDFWAPWCMPCQMQGPIVDHVARRMDGRVTVAKVNVDDAPALAQRFAIEGIPTLLILEDGHVVQRFVGVQDEGSLVRALEAVA